MSEIKYKTGWIKDPEGNKFAPITTTDQVITSDGADLASEINNIKNDVTTLNSKYAIVEKKYSLSLSENEYVQPYVRFGTLDISEDVVKYGYPISMTASDTRGVPVPLYIYHNGYGVYTLKICGWVEGNEAIVYFRKGLD